MSEKYSFAPQRPFTNAPSAVTLATMITAPAPSSSLLATRPCGTSAGEPITRDSLSPDEYAAYHRDGYVILRGILDPTRVGDIAADVLAILKARNAPDSFLAQASEYLAESPTSGLVNSARLRAIAAQALEGPAHLYLPFTAVKGPGQGQFTFHQDNSYTRLDGPACNCWFALSPMRVDNGCMRMVPGSHVSGTLEAEASLLCPGHRQVRAPSAWEDLVMEPGDAVMFSRLTVHGSGANRTQQPRLAYAVQFHRRDVRAFFEDSWELLTVRPRWKAGPVAELSATRGREV